VARFAQGYEQAHAVGVVVQLADVGAFSELAGSQGQQDGPAGREVVTEPFSADCRLRMRWVAA
jgi:hypothetical protein